jgi:sulfide:quinone oxidoreductase
METIIQVTPQFAATATLSAEDVAEVARLGFKAIVSNRPDGEEEGQLTAREEAKLARRAGLQFRHVPAAKHEVFTDAAVSAMASALADLDGPVLAHCKSGTRSLILWAAASARSQPVSRVLDTLSAAGHDLDFLRHDLDIQAGRGHLSGTAPALAPHDDTAKVAPSGVEAS